MKEFTFKADCKLMAEDLDDAFTQVAEHFRALAEEDDNAPLILYGGQLQIYPTDNPPNLKEKMIE